MNDRSKPVPMPAIGLEEGPDGELIMLCRSFIAVEEVSRAEENDDFDETPLQKEVYAKQSAMIDRLYGIRAQTVEGSVMRLRAAVAYCPELMRSGAGSLSEILLTAAIRDLTGEEVR